MADTHGSFIVSPRGHRYRDGQAGTHQALLCWGCGPLDAFIGKQRLPHQQSYQGNLWKWLRELGRLTNRTTDMQMHKCWGHTHLSCIRTAWRWNQKTALPRLLRTARRGSQVPVRFLFVDGIEIQPRVRQQAVTFVNTCARRTGRSYAKRRDGETLTQLSRHGDNSPVRQEVLQRSRAATRSINILALVSYIRVLISRTCNHLSFPIGTPRSHRSLPWALHLPRAAHAAAKLPTLF